MKNLTMTLLIVLAAGLGLSSQQASLAQTPPEPTLDVLGVFFDPDATAPEIGIGAFTPFNAYFLLLNGSASAIAGFEFSYHVEIPPSQEGLFLRLGTIYPDGVIVLLADDVDPIAGEYILGWGAPTPLQPVFRMLTWQLMLLEPLVVARITTAGVSNSREPWGVPLYWDDVMSYGLSAPWCSGWINQFCPLADEPLSFGSVKSLYR